MTTYITVYPTTSELANALEQTATITALSAGTYNSFEVNSSGQIASASFETPSNDITISGDVSGSGTTGSNIETSLATITTPGTYVKVVVDDKGRVSGSVPLTNADVENALGGNLTGNLNVSNGISASYAAIEGEITGASASIANTLNAGAIAVTGAVSGDVSGATSKPTFAGAVSTSLSNRYFINLADWGWIGDGHHQANDTAVIQAAYNAAPNNATIFIPAGSLLGNSGFNFPTYTVGKTVHWQCLGTFDYGLNPGADPVTLMGDGDAFTGMFAGRYNIWKQIINNSSEGYAALNVNFQNKSQTNSTHGVCSTLALTGNSGPNAQGYLWNLNAILTSGNTKGGG